VAAERVLREPVGVTVKVLQGHCVDVLARQPAESVQCVVTSIPYWRLRAYGTPPQTWADGWVGEWGQEPTPEQYVAHTVEAFAAVKRVLRRDGTLWLNIGDTYWNVPGGTQAGCVSTKAKEAARRVGRRPLGKHPVLKQKDMVGIPWRVAFALQADGWWLRSEVIWHKPNPMPEAVTDRPTKAHEPVFLLTRSADYFYDAEAIKEPQSEGTHARFGKNPVQSSRRKLEAPGSGVKSNASFVAATAGMILEGGRNKRSVWTIPVAAWSEAHFATFPPALVEPCVKAGSRPGDTVLDPCGGSGTVGMVADRLGRNAVLCELKPEYAAMAQRRITGDAPLFAEVEVAAG
jgi:DNA modification methylase